MTDAAPARLRAAARAALQLTLAATLAAAAAYQLLLPFTLDFGAAGPLPVAAEGLYPAEDGYRWTSGRTAVLLPGPGAGRTVTIEATVSGWRPRGRETPQLRMGAGGAVQVFQPGAPSSEYSFTTRTSSSWRGEIGLRLDSDTFEPGRGDPRRLGVRLHRVRLSSASGAFAPGVPPLPPVLWTVAAAQLLFWLLVAHRREVRPALYRALAGGLAIAAGLVLARPWTVRLLPALVSLEAAVLLFTAVLPSPAGRAAGVLGGAWRRLAQAARALRPKPLAALVLFAASGTVAAYRVYPVVVIPMGSGREAAFEEGLGTFDSAAGVRFRHLTTRAALDLRDLGGGEWRTTVTAAAAGQARVMPLVDVGGGALEAAVGPAWSSHETVAQAPLGWRSGLRVSFPVPRREDVWLREVRVDRGRAWPPLRIVLWVAAAGVLLAMAVLASGLAAHVAWVAAAAVVAVELFALAVDPVVAIPHVPRLAAIAAAGALVTALAAEATRHASSLPAAALAATGVGFMAWLASATAPLYRGGHFVFHSSIAEEIWKGRFLLYYLPYPGSMLSQQAQWGNVVVPHPCLYHVVAAPLSALPRPAFFTLEKVLLALLLAAMALSAAALAARVGGPRAAGAAALLMASMPASFQLLGLGHLMTLFGCWAMTMAVTYVVLNQERLHERRRWWRAVLLVALSFLAYFAGLLFMALVIAMSATTLVRTRPQFSRALLTAGLAAAALAFALYYVNWTWPFLSESVPRLLGGPAAPSGGATAALPARLAAAPHKLTYSFGSVLVPLLGLAGLFLARRGPERVLLLAWAAILPLFMGLDLFFNFLLKHHYYTMVPVAVGGGVLLGRLGERGRWGRLLAALAVAAVATLGARIGLDAAMGRIP